jgi:hypothetical protein
MAEVYDIALGADFDLIIKDGDFLVKESTEQHQQLLPLADKGQFKQSPTTGVGIDSYLNDEASPDDIRRDIQEQFESDGMTIANIKVAGYESLNIDAYYGTQDGTDTR